MWTGRRGRRPLRAMRGLTERRERQHLSAAAARPRQRRLPAQPAGGPVVFRSPDRGADRPLPAAQRRRGMDLGRRAAGPVFPVRRAAGHRRIQPLHLFPLLRNGGLSGMRNAAAKEIAALRCRRQMQLGRNFRSGRKTRGSAQARCVFRAQQGEDRQAADHA